MFIDPLILTANQTATKEQELLELLGNPAQADAALQELNLFFQRLPVANRSEYYYTYWRWYVILSWNSLGHVVAADFPTAVADQVVLALRVGVPVGSIILQYLENVAPADLESVYSKMRDGVAHLEVTLNPNEDATLEKQFFSVSKKEAQTHVQKLKDFCAHISTDDISKILLAYTVGTAIEPLGPIDEKKTPQAKIAPSAKQLAVMLKLLYTKSGDDEKIAAFLEKISQFYKQDKFMEIYYYDQSDNQFHWNDELLKS